MARRAGCAAEVVGFVVVPLIFIGLAALAQKSCSSGTSIGQTVGVVLWILLALLLLAVFVLKAISSD